MRDQLGAGGMGEVWRVYDRRLQRHLAMKVLRAELLADTRLVTRFIEEALATASLEHPGIVPVHDYGQLGDGRLYFTMKEVKGRSLGAIIGGQRRFGEPPRTRGRSEPGRVEGPGEREGTYSFRRLIDIFWRVCEAVACAHAHGVIHRDLKPANVMVGEYGEVIVVDWGLARRFPKNDPKGEPPPSERPGELPRPRPHTIGGRSGGSGDPVVASALAGTPAYMAPEQAQGEGASLGTSTDIYALGATLYELLTGRPPYTGSDAEAVLAEVRAGPPPPPDPALPAELLSVCARAMARSPRDRHPDARSLAAEVQAWLEGARRRAQAEAVVAQADLLIPEVERLRREAGALEREASTALIGIKAWEPAEKKQAAWVMQEEASRRLEEAARREVEGTQLLHAALVQFPGLVAAEERLAAHYASRHRELEAARDTLGAARYEVLLRGHDHGRYAPYLAGGGALSVRTEPAGAAVWAERYHERGRRLEREAPRLLGTTPLDAASLARGSYRLTLHAPGFAPMVYPVVIDRSEHWDGVPPGETDPRPLRLTPDLPAGDRPVAAGWFLAGGDPEAAFGLQRQRRWLESFVVRQHPVTMTEYLHFLNALVEAGEDAAALAYAPRERPSHIGGLGTLLPSRDQDGRFVLGGPDPDGDVWLPDWPVMMIDWVGASAFAAWEARRTGQPWRLGNELEWEKAARGVDGRLYPWGDRLDASFACVRESHPGRASPAEIQRFPLDVGPYGVRGMAGNVRTWCRDRWRPEGPEDGDDPDDSIETLRALRGGSWGQEARRARSATRAGDRPNMRLNSIGVRLFRDA